MEPLKEGQRVARNAILINSILALIKGIIGFFSGSVALISDAVHTAADSITTFASWFGLKIAERKPTEKFPYGYYKAENLATLFICIFLLYAGYELITESYSKLFTLSTLQIPHWSLGISLVSAVNAFFVSKYERKTGEKIKSQSLTTIAEDSRINVLISLIVFLGILSTHFGIPYVEGSVGIIISLMVFKIGLMNGKNAIYSLMDVSPSKEIEERIKKIIKSIPGVESFEDLKLRYAGPFIFGNVKIKTKDFLSVKKAHEISDKIENKIMGEIRQIDSFNIHIEPYKEKKQKIVIPIENNNGLKSRISNHFGRARYFIFVNLDRKKIHSYYIKNNPYEKKKLRAGLFFIYKVITKERVDVLITRSIGAISFHALRDHFVDIYSTNRRIVKNCVDDFINGKLERLDKPTRKLGKETVERVRR